LKGEKGDMAIEKKKIDMKTAALVLDKLNDAVEDDHSISLGRFIAINFEVLSYSISRSGKNIRDIYEHLQAGGLDVGTYHGFRSACYRAGLRRRAPKRPTISFQESARGVKASKEVQELQKIEAAAKTGEDRKTGISKYNPALPPVFLPGGAEAIIDPETGAQCFEIKSKKESE
jgi:hypothetical protein